MKVFKTYSEFLRHYFPKEWKRLVEEEEERKLFKEIQDNPYREPPTNPPFRHYFLW